MQKPLLILCSCFLVLDSSHAQPTIQWQKCLGGADNDGATSIQQTTDGGYIVAGYTESNDGDVTGNHGLQDSWVVKLNSSGNIQWQKCLGGTAIDFANSVQQTSDGGYIVGGFTTSNDGDVTGNHSSNYDCWVVKLDSSGIIQWQKCLGGTSEDRAYSVQQIADGSYIVAGKAVSNNGDVTGNHGNSDYWIVKLNSSGNIQWQKCLGGTGDDYAWSVQQTADEGYIVAGYTLSNDGDVTGNHGNRDYWVVKLDSIANLQWQKCLGGTDWDLAISVRQTADGGYIVAGYVRSNDGDVTGNHGSYDYWIVKLSSTGTLQWQKCLGGTGGEQAHAVEQTVDGGYVVAGLAGSNNGDVTGNHGFDDYWIVKMDSGGNLQWQKCLGGTSADYGYPVQKTTDGGYIVAGQTYSNDGDMTGNHGLQDSWVVKLSSLTGTEEESSNGSFNISPNPFTVNALISFSRPVYDATFSLYNLLGEKVAEATGINGESFELNRGNLQSGVYVFEVREKDKSIARDKAVVY